MNSTRRFIGRIGSAFALCTLLLCGSARAANLSYVFQNQTLMFTHIARTAAGSALGVDDPAFRSLLKSLGATLTWHPGERYVLISTPQPLVINFAVGSKSYDVGLLSANASFAPFLQGQEAFLPLDDLLHSLGLTSRSDGSVNVLQPQLTSVDIKGSGNQAVVVAHAAMPLHPRLAVNEPSRLVYVFDGVASSIDGIRQVNVGGIRLLKIISSGSVRRPSTTIEVDLAPNARHGAPRSNDGDFEVAFGGSGGAPPLVNANVAANPQPPSPSVAPAPVNPPAAGATVSAVTVTPSNGGETVTIAMSGNATYDWHRLRPPDNRFWIDIHGAQLEGGNKDEAQPDPLTSLRIRQNDAQTVRVALSLSGPKSISVSPSANGILINIGNTDAFDVAREGSGTVGNVVSANEPQPLITPVPADEYGQVSNESAWKFGPQSSYVPTNPRLIVLDPGHGGGDRGSVHDGMQEAVLTLDMARRVEALLIARGWQVKMTHNGDHDVHGTPRSKAEAEAMGYTSPDAFDLQARDDIANAAGARLFVSIHANAFMNSGPNGTTYYYYTPQSLPFAQEMEQDLDAADLGTKDDGVHKVKYYVVAHANMPAILIETAFLTNPFDRERLASSSWRQHIAEAIADGIDQYARAHPVGQAQ